MTPEERAEVAPGFVPSDDVSTPLSVKVADEAVSLATPIDSIVEIQEELAKEEPDYLKIGMLGGMEAIGLLAPGAGKAAQSMIRKGADMARQTDSVVDVASNIPQVPRSVTPSYTDEALLEADDILAEWGKGNLTNPQLRKAMSDKGFKIETKTISPKMTPDDIEVVGPDGNIVLWKDMPRGTKVDASGDIPKSSINPFKKTRPAYKLFVKRDGKLYPLFVNASDEIPVNEWLEADFPDVAFKGKTQKGGEGWYVPTKGAKRDPDRFFLDGEEITKKEYNKLGPNSKPFATVVRGEQSKATGDRIVIPDEETRQKLIDAGFITEKTGRTKDAPYGKVTAVAARPGYHASVNPVAEHLGPQDIKVTKDEVAKLLDAGVNPKAIRHRGDQYYVKRRAEDQYWAEVEMADDTSDELRAYMESQGRTDINDKVPKGGSYSYVDGQADGDTWVVGGDMKVKKILSREEAKAAQEAAGVKDLPYRDEIEEILGRKFAEGGLAGEDMYTGQQDYLLASSSGIEMSEGGSLEKQTEAVFKSSRGYAEGGEVGAAPDTTIGVDPVSGNEVPMGATPEEVRDDIPAQLSEGEYVVPADVVRFYGVKFFEDLRTEAKQGYAEMDQNGRIGGEPVGPEGMEMIEPEDDLPFDISELQMIDDEVEMAEGGYLERAMNREEPINRFESLLQFLFKDKDEYGETPIDRYKEQMGDDDMGFFESFMGNPIERGERKYGKKGYAEGGDTAPLVTNPFSPTGSTGGFEIKEYVNDAGEVMYIQFMNGQPMTFIPQGFRPKASASEQAATGAGVAATAAPATAGIATTGSDYNDRLDSMDVPEPKGKTARESWTDASLEEITKDAANLGYSNSLVSTGLGAINPLLGTAAGVGMGSASRSKAYDMLDGIAYQIETLKKNPEANASKIDELVKQQGVIQKYLEPSSKSASPATSLLKGSGIFGKQTSMYENLSDFGGDAGSPDGRVTFADTWLGDLLGFDGKAGIQATDEKGELLTLGRSLAGDRRQGSEEYEGSVEAAKKRKLAEQEAAKAKEKESSGNAALDAVMAKGIGASDAEQDRLNAIAAAARNNPTEENKQAAINAGLGWMFTK